MCEYIYFFTFFEDKKIWDLKNHPKLILKNTRVKGGLKL